MLRGAFHLGRGEEEEEEAGLNVDRSLFCCFGSEGRRRKRDKRATEARGGGERGGEGLSKY